MRVNIGHMGGRRAVALLIGAGALVAGGFSPAPAATFSVNSYGEASDAVPGDGVAEIQPGTGITTFHAAIEEANASLGPDTIVFDLDPNQFCACTGPPCRYELKYTKPLPPVNDPSGGTTIDASGITWMTGQSINPALGDPNFNAAIVLLSANNVVKHLSLIQYPGAGIVISGAAATGNTLENNSIGAACPGTFGCSGDGIRIESGASANVVSDTLIVNSTGYGVQITGEGSDGNVVLRSHIGLFPVSLTSVCGVDVDVITERTPLPVPPLCPQEVLTDAHAMYRTSSAGPNRLGQVSIGGGASENTIGGLSKEDMNWIGGSFWVMDFTTGEYGTCGTLGTLPNSLPGSDAGVILEGQDTSGNRVQGNHIGIRNVAVIEYEPVTMRYFMQPRRDMTGFATNVVLIRGGATNNIIGHEDNPALGNVLAYSFGDGVQIEGSLTTDNIVANNTIRAEAAGVALKDGTRGNLIGGAGDGNTIRAREYGVEIDGLGTEDNTLTGNVLNGNGFSGVAIRGGAAGNTVGGTAAGEGNELSSNCSDGVVIFEAGSNGNQVLGNEIAGNGEIGVFMVTGASNNIIGGVTPGAGNNIHDNAVTGVEIHDVVSTGNQILGNEIHGNGTRGVFMVDGTSGNIVGGVPLAERNKVYDNELSGIEINGANTFENQIRLNSIYDNGEKGILLSFGANKGIAPPIIETFVPFAGTAPPNSFVDIFSDGAEEGKTYIGSTSTDAEGNFSVALNLGAYLNTNLTSTATDSAGDTSEFSAPIAIIPPVYTETPADRVVVEGDDLNLAVTLTGSPVIQLQWRFRTAGGNFAELEDSESVAGSDTASLSIEDAGPGAEGYYQCVADNGLGGVNSREIFVRVVSADIAELEVNTLGDANDGDTSSFARLLAAPGADGLVSLREAILAANTMAGENTIRFSVEGAIQPESPLPDVSDATGGLTLDGMDALTIDGALLGDTGSGLTLTSGGNVVTRLGLYNFPEHGLVLSGAGATGNQILDCRIGTNGELALGNEANGIFILGGASNNQIGGATAGEGNHIAGNDDAGIVVSGAGSAENLIIGNTLGENEDGLPAGGNLIAAVRFENGASDNRVGGDESGEGNRITGNAGIGVWIVGADTVRNTVAGNTLFGNADLGIRLFEGGNQNIVRPEFSTVSPIAGIAPPNSRVDCYVDDADEGEHFLVTLNADGEGAFGAALDLQDFDGRYLTAIATDMAGNTSAFSRPAPIDFTPPVLALNGPTSITIECATTLDDPGATASDNIDGNMNDQITVSFEDQSGAPLANLEGAAPGTYFIRYNVTDGAGLEAETLSRTIIIEDTTAPQVTLTGAASQTIGCGESFSDPGATALDLCDSEIVAEVSGVVNTAAPGVYALTYTATDASGNTAAPVLRTVTVEDRTAPEITLLGDATMALECGAAYIEPGATASDDCGGEVEVQVLGAVNTGQAGEYTLTYRASDSEGNEAAEVTRTVTVADTTPPVLTLVGDAEIVQQCGQGYAELGASVEDTCDAVADLVITGDVDPNTIGVYTRHYDATDANGNAAATITRTITIVGAAPPEIALTGPATVTVACGGNYQDAGASAVDGCQSDISGAIVVRNPVNTAVPGVYTVTYNVADGTGDSAEEVVRTVTVLPCGTPCDTSCAGQPNDLIDADGDGLSACKEQCATSSDADPDSDNDGMPDGFEYRHQLSLRTNDADLDLDLDGLTNLEEYLEGASPRNAADPVQSYYVSPTGVDDASAGTAEEPWRSIGYALSRLESAPSGSSQLFIDSGVYVEDLALVPGLVVRAVADADVEIMGSVTAPAGSTLRDVTITSDGADTALLFITGGNVSISGCIFNGEFGQNLTGVVAGDLNLGPQSANPSVIEGCVFTNLAHGISVEGVMPHVRQCQFINISGAGITILPDAILREDMLMGDGLNGWNDFSQIGEGFAIANQSAGVVSAQWNDWGTEDAVELGALVEGEVDQANALGEGGASAAAALEFVVSNGKTQARIGNARVTLTGGGTTLQGSTNAQGRIAFPLLPAGAWQVTVTASGFPNATETINLGAGTYRVANVVMRAEDIEEPIDEGCTSPAKTASRDESRRGDLVLLGLLLACLFTGQIARMGRQE